MDIYLHPLFDGWLRSLSGEDTDDGVDWWEVQAEIAALLTALETHGRGLGDPECHEVVSARYDMHALRRTPPTTTTPYADAPPVLRLLFAFVADSKGGDAAVVLIGGDKAQLGNRWYPPHVRRTGETQDGMEEAHTRQLPADDASTDEVPPDAWQDKVTPRTLYDQVSADPRARTRFDAALAEIDAHQATLAQVRRARALTQATLAELLEMDQSEVSRLEHRSNMLLSTLRSFIRATGGELQLIATFPDAEPIQLLIGSEQ